MTDAAPAPAPVPTPASAPETTPVVPTGPVVLAARDAELTALFEHDPNRYQYDDNGRWANEHFALRKAQQPKDPTEAVDADPADGDIEGEAELGRAEGEADEEPDESEQTEPRAPWPERPDSLKDATPEQVEAWREEQGLPAREEYRLPELDEGLEYTVFGEALGEKVVQLAYDLDMSPAQAEQLVLKGDGIVKALAESRDAEDNRVGSKALIEQFGGDRDAAKAHVASARAAVKGLPDGLGELLLQSRGPDGRKLAYLPEFLRWAAQLGAKPGVTWQPQQDRRTMMQAELAEIDALMARDVSELYRPFKNTGMSASDHKLAILRELNGDGPKRASPAELRSEEAELMALHEHDPQVFAYTPNWRGTNKTAAARLFEIRSGRG